MPSALPTLSRRRMLVATAALALLSATAAGCAPKAPNLDVDALVGQLERARGDGALAESAAASAPPKLGPVLTAVAAERAAHALALTDEITRMTGDAPASAISSAPSSATASSTPAGPPPKPPTPADVVAALKESADGASLIASQQSGYRAGLLGSIAAACTAAGTVALAGVGSTR